MEKTRNGDEILKRHLKYLYNCQNCLPFDYITADNTRVTLFYFIISSLDLLHENLDKNYIKSIYELQYKESTRSVGFRGSKLDYLFSTNSDYYFPSNIAMTYSALVSLIILGDNLEVVERGLIINCLKDLQQPNGCFKSYRNSLECDLRFLYCAASISFILDDWSGFDIPNAINYIKSCISYDGGIGLRPGLESHGGSTFCAIASLSLIGGYELIKECLSNKTIEWCVLRCEGGFCGRVNKPEDTCYSFWVGASLKLLHSYDLINPHYVSSFLETTETEYGGYAKEPDSYPDLLHSYFGLGGLSLTSSNIPFPLKTMRYDLNMSADAFNNLILIHASWREGKGLERIEKNK
jgi:geranylgeranyl transferase type-1 subunit beta